VREPGSAQRLDPVGPGGPDLTKAPAFAVAGVARPDRFFGELRDGGWDVRGTVTFPDHYRYRLSDVTRVADAARAAGASAIVTTEKDAVRLQRFRPLPLPCLWVPLTARIEPEPAFREWLRGRLADERSRPERTCA
jgi:tetraacyldisaccharide 4'-kinase